jgi:F0F1-type ATP synthase assembly protein I
LAQALELPFFPVVGLLLGGGGGYWLDAKFGTRPFCALFLGAAGFAAGIVGLIKRASTQGKKNGAV